MEISLRKAAALQLSITEALSTLRMDATLTVSIYEEAPEERIRAQAQAWSQALDRRTGLLDALYDIRTRLGEANQSFGVNRILAEHARIERDVQLYVKLSQLDPREAPEILKARMERMRTREPAPTSRFGGAADPQETLQVGLFDHDEIEGFSSELRRLKRLRQKIKDELVELNAASRISLHADTVSILTNEELI